MISEVIYSVYSPAASFSQNAVEQSILLEIDGGRDHRLVFTHSPSPPEALTAGRMLE